MAIDDGDAGKREAVEVEPGVGRQPLGFSLQRVAERLEADDALRHHAEDRRMQARVREPLDLVEIVVGDKLARSALLEIGDRLDAAQRLAVEVAIERRAVILERKGRVRLITDSRADLDLVDAAGDRLARRVDRQFAALRIKVARHRNRLRAGRDQGIGTLEIVVLQQRLVDLRGEHAFVLAVRLHRIEMLGPLGERRIEDILAALAGRIRVVLLAAARGKQQQRDDDGEAKKKHGAKCSASVRRCAALLFCAPCAQ